MSSTTLDRPAPSVDPPPSVVTDKQPVVSRRLTRMAYRFRLTAVCAVLTALSFIQDPGQIAADTKLDLSIDPGGLLARSMHLWDTNLFSGSLQNQAYGYLWPMGPFFWAGNALGVPPWVVQRAWWSLLLCVAFLGVVKLVRVLGLGGPLVRVMAGLAYATSPMLLTKLGLISSEVLPIALAPWLLIPLVYGSERGSPRRWAALSALALFCTGGINATATVAILPIGVLWILTRSNGRRKWSLLGWWSGCVALASLWWLIPLLILGKYSPPFLNWIESASVTTGVASPANALRGTGDWLAYIYDRGGPVAGVGWTLVSNPVLIAATGILAALGIAGLARRDVPQRLFLVTTMSVGLVALTLGHTGPIDGVGAEGFRTLLDGVLSPLRNVHKFDPVLRLPLALGFAWCLTALLRRRSRSKMRDIVWKSVAVAAAAAVALGATPLLTGAITRDRGFLAIPGYWSDAASWLDRTDPTGRALLVPGASFGDYLWGRSQDEPLQPLADTPWAVRDSVPLSSAGNIRFLDAVEQRLENGVGSAGLAAALNRAGFSYLVVRNDLDPDATGAPRAALVHQALSRTPGVELAQSFGPLLTPWYLNGMSYDSGLVGTYAAVEIFKVTSPASTGDTRVSVRDATATVGFDGTSEALIDLLDAGLVTDGPTVTTTDAARAPALPVATRVHTDSYRDREVNFGQMRDNTSNTRTVAEPFALFRPVHDFYPVVPDGWQPFARFEGVRSVTASSSGSAVDAFRARAPASQPFSALDGDPQTAWVSGDYAGGIGQWWQVDLDKPAVLDQVRVKFVQGGVSGSQPRQVNVTTDAGTVSSPVSPSTDWQVIPVARGQSTALRIELAGVAAPGGGNVGGGSGFGISEVEIPGVVAGRPLVSAELATSSDAIVMTARDGYRAGCLELSTRVVCAPQLTQAAEENAGIDRVIRVAKDGTYQLTVGVTPRPGESGGLLIQPLGKSITASASSSLVPDVASRPFAATDLDLGTTWIAGANDSAAQLTLVLPESRTIKGLQFYLSEYTAASSPLQVEILAGGRTFWSYVGTDGSARIPPTKATEIKIRFRQVSPKYSIAAGSALLPVGVTEVAVLGAQDLRRAFDRRLQASVPCGFGPRLEVDGEVVADTSVTTTGGDILQGRGTVAKPCGAATSGIGLKAGTHRVQVRSTGEFLTSAVVLSSASPSLATPGAPPSVVRDWDNVNRSVDIAATDHDRTLEFSENANPGWRATLAGNVLTPVVVDGWRQAWVVPAGVGGTVEAQFAPDSGYRLGLLAGIAALVLLLVVGVIRPRGRTDGPVGAAQAWLVACVVGVAAVLMLGGIVGLVVGAVCMIALLRWPKPAPLVAGVLVLMTVAAQVLYPWPQSQSNPGWLVGLLSLLVVGAIAAVFSADFRYVLRRPK
ncbi:MAG: alpha-(1-_3)-arabinofuranosyltransferase [Actinomycetes bacterium]